jgi:aspartate/methionine/tyrosine aminotransferase
MNQQYFAAHRALKEMPGSQLVAIARAAFEKGDVDFLCFGESDLSSPAQAVTAAKLAIDEVQNTRYPDLRGLPALRNGLAAYLSGLHAKPVDEQRIQITASGMAAINVAFSAVVQPGDDIVLLGPAWPNIQNLAHLRGASVREVPLTLGEHGFVLDFDMLEQALCGASTFFLNSPNNPTGWTASADELVRMLGLCRRYGVWLVADEVYSRIYYEAQAAPSVLDVADPEDRVIVCNSFSKAWAMTGWRVGWLVVPEASRSHFTELVELTHSGVAPFSQVGALAALQDGEFVQRFRRYCAQGREIVAEALSDMANVEFQSPPGAFYAFLKVDGMTDSYDFAMRLVHEQAVAVAPGSAFGPVGEGYIRLCYAKEAGRLSSAINKLQASIAGIRR